MDLQKIKINKYYIKYKNSTNLNKDKYIRKIYNLINIDNLFKQKYQIGGDGEADLNLVLSNIDLIIGNISLFNLLYVA